MVWSVSVFFLSHPALRVLNSATIRGTGIFFTSVIIIKRNTKFVVMSQNIKCNDSAAVIFTQSRVSRGNWVTFPGCILPFRTRNKTRSFVRFHPTYILYTRQYECVATSVILSMETTPAIHVGVSAVVYLIDALFGFDSVRHRSQ